VGLIVGAHGVAQTKAAVPVCHVVDWSMVACSGDELEVVSALLIAPIDSEVSISDIAEV